MAKQYSFKYKGWALGAGEVKGEAYAIELREDGSRGSRCRLFTPRKPEEAARVALIAFVDKLVAGAAGDDPLVADVIDAYVSKLEREHRVGVDAARSAFKRIAGTFGGLRVSSLSTVLCQTYATSQETEGYSRSTIHGDLSKLRQAVKWGSHTGNMYKEDHYRRLWNISAPPPRQRVLSPQEAHALLHGATALHVRLFILMGLLTSQRHAAMLELRWDRVDLDNDTIDFRVEHTRGILDKGFKKGRAVVKIAPPLKAALLAAKAVAKTPWVLEYQGVKVRHGVYGGFYAARDAAGLGDDVVPHTLRHTALTWGANAGITAEFMTRLSGHKDDRTYKNVYVHPDAAGSSTAVDAVAGVFATGGGLRRVK